MSRSDSDRRSIAVRIASDGLLVALAMIFGYIESLLPAFTGIPGVKLGLANLVMLSGLFLFGVPEVLMIMILRIVLTGIMFGNVYSIIYSLAGGLLSLLVMIIMKRIKGLSIVGVSILGGVSHNMGQLIAAGVITGGISVIYYAPVLLISGTVCGMLIGIVAGRILDHLPTIRKEG
ncbi:MAG: Gx transporter family protein [Lachnospiraceae bacterium]|nr:Gx transporter family protein [Lachnospiraceae bacterium]